MARKKTGKVAKKAMSSKPRPLLAELLCIYDKSRRGDTQNLDIAQASDAIAALADIYWDTPELFAEEFFGRHVPAAAKRTRPGRGNCIRESRS